MATIHPWVKAGERSEKAAKERRENKGIPVFRDGWNMLRTFLFPKAKDVVTAAVWDPALLSEGIPSLATANSCKILG